MAEYSAESGRKDVLDLMGAMLPFPPRLPGEAAEDHFALMTPTEAENAYVFALMIRFLIGTDKKRQVDSAAIVEAVLARSADYAGSRPRNPDLRAVEQAMTGRLAQAGSILAAVEAARRSEDTLHPRVARKIDMVASAMGLVQDKGIAIFDDNHGQPTLYAVSGLLQLFRVSAPGRAQPQPGADARIGDQPDGTAASSFKIGCRDVLDILETLLPWPAKQDGESTKAHMARMAPHDLSNCVVHVKTVLNLNGKLAGDQEASNREFEAQLMRTSAEYFSSGDQDAKAPREQTERALGVLFGRWLQAGLVIESVRTVRASDGPSLPEAALGELDKIESVMARIRGSGTRVLRSADEPGMPSLLDTRELLREALLSWYSQIRNGAASDPAAAASGPASGP